MGRRAKEGYPVKARRTKVMVLLVVGLLAASTAVVVAQDEAGSDGLVTEEVEPGVVRIVSDGAGHDLEERHPTKRYDMDDVFVAPDGTVWLESSYQDPDNDANPPGGLVWALGQEGTAQYPAGQFCFAGGFIGDTYSENVPGVTCYDPATDTETRYLTTTGINAVAAAPDGTFWAVGADGAENGGLYHITPE
jgi:hypothetical protein